MARHTGELHVLPRQHPTHLAPLAKLPIYATSEGGKKDPTVGRRKNLLWVASTTYGRSLWRPTVGFFCPFHRLGLKPGEARI